MILKIRATYRSNLQNFFEVHLYIPNACTMSSSDEEYYTADEDIIDIKLHESKTRGFASSILVYPDHIQFLINFILLWPENRIDSLNSENLYQKYSAWCKVNSKTPCSNAVLGKKFSQIGIRRQRAGGGKRKWQYILDRSKIMNKIHQLFGSP